jgi:hypothetical protein
MDKVVTASEPIISADAVIPHAVLTISELVDNQDRIKPVGTWRPSAFGHATLQLYFDDDATGTTRTTLVEWQGTSKFGLGFFKGEQDVPTQAAKGKKEKKMKKPSANIAIEYDSSPQAQVFDAVWNDTTERAMKGSVGSLIQLLSPSNPHVACIQREVARASSGYSQKKINMTCIPGKVELITKDNKNVSMNDFTKDVEGDYILVTDTPYIDASLNNGVITFGPVSHVRYLKETTLVVSRPLVLRSEAAGGEAGLLDKIKKKREKERKEKEKPKSRYDTMESDLDFIKKESKKKRKQLHPDVVQTFSNC